MIPATVRKVRQPPSYPSGVIPNPACFLPVKISEVDQLQTDSAEHLVKRHDHGHDCHGLTIPDTGSMLHPAN